MLVECQNRTTTANSVPGLFAAGPRANGCSTVETVVASSFRLPTAALRAPTRCFARVALARQVAMYLCHVLLGMTLSEVGRHFGRDRTTVSHACRVVEDRRDDPGFDTMLDRIEYAIGCAAKAGEVPAQRVRP